MKANFFLKSLFVFEYSRGIKVFGSMGMPYKSEKTN